MQWSSRKSLRIAAAAFAVSGSAALCHADGRIDASTLVAAAHGTFNGVAYTRYEAMFQGVTSNNRPYRVPCQIIAPQNTAQGDGLLLFDWLVPSTIPTAVGQEQADARYTMTDEFLFGRGIRYATVRCQAEAIGRSSPVPDFSRPWSDNLLNTSSEFITSGGDQFDIVVDYNIALRTDPVATTLLGTIDRRAAFGYSYSGSCLRGLLRLRAGEGLFDFSLIGGAGNGVTHPTGNGIAVSMAEKAPLEGAGLEIDFNSECDIIVLGGAKARHEEPNYRCYEFAGAAHLRDVDAAEFGLPNPQAANPAEWTPFFRALFVAADQWCDGVTPPPTLWLGAPSDTFISRDANGNALVRIVGGLPYAGGAYRLPEVAVGQNTYIPIDPSYRDGTFSPGTLRFLAGSHIDLTGNFTDHAAYVLAVTAHARTLQAQRYLLVEDADEIILRAINSGIGR